MLSELGIPFSVVRSDAVEKTSGGSVSALARANALAKVRGAEIPKGSPEGAFVLGVDTLVSTVGRVMGKPSSSEEAAEMLSSLAGRGHRVVSGMALGRVVGAPTGCGELPVAVSSAATKVTFAKLDERQVDAYVETGEWKGKAGGYAVQGLAALFVRSIEGEYSNVVGLPLHLMYRMFAELGVDLVRRIRSGGDGEREIMAKSQ